MVGDALEALPRWKRRAFTPKRRLSRRRRATIGGRTEAAAGTAWAEEEEEEEQGGVVASVKAEKDDEKVFFGLPSMAEVLEQDLEDVVGSLQQPDLAKKIGSCEGTLIQEPASAGSSVSGMQGDLGLSVIAEIDEYLEDNGKEKDKRMIPRRKSYATSRFKFGDEVVHVYRENGTWTFKEGIVTRMKVDSLQEGLYYVIAYDDGKDTEGKATEGSLLLQSEADTQVIYRAETFAMDARRAIDAALRARNAVWALRDTENDPDMEIWDAQHRQLTQHIDTLQKWALFAPPVERCYAKMDLAHEVQNSIIRSTLRLIRDAQSQLLIARSQIYLDADKCQQALTDADEACIVSPDCKEAAVARACALVAAGRNPEIIREEVVDEEPDLSFGFGCRTRSRTTSTIESGATLKSSASSHLGTSIVSEINSYLETICESEGDDLL